MPLPSVPPNKIRYRFSIVTLVGIAFLPIGIVMIFSTEEIRREIASVSIVVLVLMYVVISQIYELVQSMYKLEESVRIMLEKQARIKLEQPHIALKNRQRMFSTFFDITILLLLGAFIAWVWTLIVASSDPFVGAGIFLPLLLIPLLLAFPIFFVKFIKLVYAIYLHKATKELKVGTGLKIFLHLNGYVFAIIAWYLLVPSHLDVVAVYMAPITKSIDAVVNKTGLAPQDITPMLKLITNPTDQGKLFYVQGVSFERHTLKSLYDPEYFYGNNRYVLAFDVSFAMPEMSTHYCYNSTIKHWISYGYPDGDRRVLDTHKTATTMKSVRYKLEDGHYTPEIIDGPRSCACCN